MGQTSYIKAGWVIDGTGGPILSNITLKIVDGRFESILDGEVALEVDSNLLTDLSHCTIFPPLVDSHLHLFMSSTTDAIIRDRQLVADCTELNSAIGRHLHDLFSHGILGVRDGGDRGGCAALFRETPEMHPEVVLKVSGRAYHREGRYGRLIGRSVPIGKRLVEAYLEREQQGDVVKIVNSGLNSLNIFGKETEPQFSQEELEELVVTAEQHGQKVMVHANGKEPVRSAVAAGCHSIEHGNFMGEENLKLMAEKGTYWVPTVFTMKAYGLNIGYTRSRADTKVIEKTVERQMDQLRMARTLGVKVVLGTDAGSLGVLHGEAMVEEMKLFKKAGYTLSETVHCATIAGAKLLGIDDFRGIREGGKATFLVSRGAPAQLPRKILYLENIYVDGAPSVLYRKNPVKHMK
ncbi:MAG: imidazolonepropionase-like amidohydrolase [Desulforhopalus sp.]|jgi:imidazolonepropionase-like amidohydrolase